MTIYKFLNRYFSKKVATVLTAIVYLIFLMVIWYNIGREEGEFRYLKY